jgi:hypothetical protein
MENVILHTSMSEEHVKTCENASNCKGVTSLTIGMEACVQQSMDPQCWTQKLGGQMVDADVALTKGHSACLITQDSSVAAQPGLAIVSIEVCIKMHKTEHQPRKM